MKCKSHFNFLFNNWNSYTIIKYNKKQKKHDKILMLAKSKLNSIEKLISQALIALDIVHEEFTRILKEKDKYERMKENLRSENEEYKIMRLSSIKLKTQKIKNKKYIFFGGGGYNIRSKILLCILYY